MYKSIPSSRLLSLPPKHYTCCSPLLLSKAFTTTASRSAPAAKDTGGPPRVYRYAIDVHGQLFLHDTKPKNLTSCFKNKEFLNFFFARIRPNDGQPAENARLEEDWPDRSTLTLHDAFSFGRLQSFHWISPCQGEYNLIRVADTPIVFRELHADGMLTWAGTHLCAFKPDKLRIDAESGYLYHPSPEPALRSLREKFTDPYGAYSLVSSAVALQTLSDGLDIDPERFRDGIGGSIRWQGKRYDLALLQPGDVARDRKFHADDLAGGT